MNILVLHGMGEEKNWISSWEDTELMFLKYDSENNYITHNCYLPLPGCIKLFDFNAVIMMSTFIDWVKRFHLDDPWIKQYEFLKEISAIKICFSQDDYWLSEVRDSFYVDYGIKLLFPSCSNESWGDLFPKFMKCSGTIIQGYTAYLTQKMLDLAKNTTPWHERKTDIVYRASGIPTYPNKLGYIKATIGERFLEKLTLEHKLNLDISTSKKSFIRGDKWYDFVGNSKAILGSNSGSSINIRNHTVATEVAKYRLRYPNATHIDIEKNVLNSVDTNKNYTGISPRNIEAAMLGTLQILVYGNYSGILEPYKHYIPLQEDASNVVEIVSILKDQDFCLQVIENCRKAFLSQKNLYAEEVIKFVLSYIDSNSKNKSSNSNFILLQKSYLREINWIKTQYQLTKPISLITNTIKRIF